MDNCFTAFIVLGGGATIGAILFVCECFSRMTNLNFKFLESYDRGDNRMDDLDPDDVRAVVDMKDAIIDELAEEVWRINKTHILGAAQFSRLTALDLSSFRL